MKLARRWRQTPKSPNPRPVPPRFGRENSRDFPDPDWAGIGKKSGILPRSRFGRDFGKWGIPFGRDRGNSRDFAPINPGSGSGSGLGISLSSGRLFGPCCTRNARNGPPPLGQRRNGNLTSLYHELGRRGGRGAAGLWRKKLGIFPDLNPDLAGIPGFGKWGIPIWPGFRDSGNGESRLGRDLCTDFGIREMGNPGLAGIGAIPPRCRGIGDFGVWVEIDRVRPTQEEGAHQVHPIVVNPATPEKLELESAAQQPAEPSPRPDELELQNQLTH
jgi:hypothetical protein